MLKLAYLNVYAVQPQFKSLNERELGSDSFETTYLNRSLNLITKYFPFYSISL